MSFCVKILGSSSAVPAYGRKHSAQLVTINTRHYLVDCGEGTQMTLADSKIKINNLDAIFISHLHGDHYLGLTGLISSLHLLGRTRPLKIYAPVGLVEIITIQLKYSQTVLGYNLTIRELTENIETDIYETKTIRVSAFKVKHRIDCWGFLFSEKPKPHRINKKVMPEEIKIQDITTLKKGEDVIDEDGKVKYRVSKYTLPPRRSRSYAYCSDTSYFREIIPIIKNVDLLYHEATFLNDKKALAEKTFHSTPEIAAKIARDAKVKRLIIGHFSARYKDLKPFLDEVKKGFRASALAEEGAEFCIEE